MTDSNTEITPPDASPDKNESERVYGDFYRLYMREGYLGANISLEDFSTNRDLQSVLSGLLDFDRNQGKPKPANIDPSFEQILMLNDFIDTAREKGVIGVGIKPRTLVEVDGLFSVVLTQMQNKGVDVSNYVGSDDNITNQLPDNS